MSWRMNTYLEDEQMSNQAKLSQKDVIWTKDFEEVTPTTLKLFFEIPNNNYIKIYKFLISNLG